MKRLILVRHGETEENISGTVQGHLPGRLSAIGRQQIQKLGSRLKNESIDIIYSSDLARARETALAIHQYHSCPIEYRTEIRERGFGIYEGRIWEDFDGDRMIKAESREDYRPQGGESLRDVQERARQFLSFLREAHPDKSVLVCAHGGFNRMFLGVLLEKGPREMMLQEQSNTCVNIFDCVARGDGLRLEARLLNCISHLQEGMI
jgi:broad specificity phosphatase PhoE